MSATFMGNSIEGDKDNDISLTWSTISYAARDATPANTAAETGGIWHDVS